MAKLPDDSVLGPLPSAESGRPIASYDTIGYAKGAAAIGAGAADIGKGISSAVKDVTAVQADQQTKANDFDQAKATANYLVQTKKIRDDLSTETNPDTLADTYNPKFQQAQNDSAAMIGDARTRELWTLKTAPDVTGHQIAVGDKTYDLQKTGQIAGVQDQLEQLRQSALKTQDPVQRAEFIKTGQSLIGGLKDAGYIDAVNEQKYRTKWTQDYAIGAVSVMSPEDQVRALSPTVASRDQVLDRIGGAENATGNPAARNPTSSAMGNFQFTKGTWLDVVAAHRPDLLQGRDTKTVLDLRADPKLSREMAGYLTDDNAAVLRSQGIAATGSNLYLAHFLGVGDAVKVIQAPPGTPVADVVSPDSIAANKSVLAGKTTDTVAAWSASKMGGPPKTKGDLLDFIPEDQRVSMLHTATENVAANGIDGARRTKLQEQQIKDTSDSAENELLKNLYSDNPTVTARSIVADERLTREAKERMIVKAQQALTDANSKADKTYGAGFYDAYSKVHATEGTPGRITDPTELYSRVGPKGDLTVAGVDKLVTEIAAKKTPEGEAEAAYKKAFFDNAYTQMAGTDPLTKTKDPKGDEIYLKWLAQTMPAYEAGKKAGKTPVQLLNPDSSDYIGKSIEQMKRPMNVWMADVLKDSPDHNENHPDHGKKFDVSTVNSLPDLVAAYQSGKVSQSAASELAISKGWAKRTAAPAASVQVSQ